MIEFQEEEVGGRQAAAAPAVAAKPALGPHKPDVDFGASILGRDKKVKVDGLARSRAKLTRFQVGSMGLFEDKFSNLAIKFRRSMNVYGLLEDVSLLLDPRSTAGCSNTREYSKLAGKHGKNWASSEDSSREHTGGRWFRFVENLDKLFSFSLVILANSTAIYVMVAHFVWEFRMLDSRASDAAIAASGAGAKSSSSMLKDFLENLRRHLARFFSLGLTLTWHLSCHKIERLFVDCQRYHSMFYKWKHQYEDSSDDGVVDDDDDADGIGPNKLSRLQSRQQRRQNTRAKETLEASSSFYQLARKRINLAIWLPVLHYLFNIMSVTVFPSSNKRSVVRISSGPKVQPENSSPWAVLGSMFQQAMDNFDSFHLAIHTAFHPYEHRLVKGAKRPLVGYTTNSTSSSSYLAAARPSPAPVVSIRQSAVYCLIELFIYSIYFHGPRIICATCLSLVLHIHYQCLRAFNRQLLAYIRRPKGRPLTSSDLVSLVKQYDLISMMHERIERAFKWSIVLWYTLMFVSCLMHIFSFTESTSAYVVSSSSAAGGTGSSQSSSFQVPSISFSSFPQQPQKLPEQPQQPATSLNQSGELSPAKPSPPAAPKSRAKNWHSLLVVESSQVGANYSASNGAQANQPSASQSAGSTSSSSIAIMFIRLASVFFVCYSPCLIYQEAFKIEAASVRVEQLVLRLVRRQGDPLAQSIEPTLFEPIYLSVGGYFNLTKKSISSFLGAVVTFSVMFIGANGNEGGLGDEPNEDELDGDQEEPEREQEEEDEEEDEASGEPETVLGAAGAAVRGNGIEPVEEEQAEQRQQQAGAAGYPQADENLPGDAPESEPLGPNQIDAPIGQLLSRRLGLILPPPRASGQNQSSSLVVQPPQGYSSQQRKARQRRKFKRLKLKQLMEQQRQADANGSAAQLAAPRLELRYEGRVREHERLVELTPKLRVLNQAAEVCDFELRPAGESHSQAQRPGSARNRKARRRWSPDQAGGPVKQEASAASPEPGAEAAKEAEVPFVISWIDRVSGEATLEAAREDFMDCERRRNYTFKIRAIGCNGLDSNEALVSVTVEDVNEFSPEFERHFYSATHEQEPQEEEEAAAADDAEKLASRGDNNASNMAADNGAKDASAREGKLLLVVQARDRDCSAEFGSICRYELLAEQQPDSGAGQLDGLTIDASGRIWMRRQVGSAAPARRPPGRPVRRRTAAEQTLAEAARFGRRSFQVIAYDCGGKKSQSPALVQINFNRLCRPALKALVSVTVEDVNEFSPEFERHFYSATHEQEPQEEEEAAAADDAEKLASRGDNNASNMAADNGAKDASAREGKLLLVVQARDRDCSAEFGSICRYELLAEQQPDSGAGQLDGLTIDASGRIWMRRQVGSAAPARRPPGRPVRRRTAAEQTLAEAARFGRRSFQVIAYDCGGKKSQSPALVQINFNRLCRPALKDVDMLLAYKPGSGARSPFLRAQLDLCGSKCHRPNISIAMRLDAAPANPQQQDSWQLNRSDGSASQREHHSGGDHLYPEHGSSAFHCDRDSYSMISKRRLCGARGRTMELLPPLSAHTSWILPLARHASPNIGPTMGGAAATGSGAGSAAVESRRPSGGPAQTSSGGGEAEPAARWPEESGNLGAYSAGSVYSKRALQFQLDEMERNSHRLAPNASRPEAPSRQSARRAGISRLNNGAGPNQHRPAKGQHSPQPARQRDARQAGDRKWATSPDGGHNSQQQQQQQLPLNGNIDSANIYHDRVYQFDGHSSAVQVPRTVYGPDLATTISRANNSFGRHLFGSKHTISFWMRHSQFRFMGPTTRQQRPQVANETDQETGPSSQRELDELARHVKEHLVCATIDSSQTTENHRASSSSASSSSSHHVHETPKNFYSIFIRNCRLVLLMRRKIDAQQQQQASNDTNNSKVYLPAEWRWSLPANEACDNKWHLYTINVNFPTVELYIDGSQFEESYDNLVIVDDLLLRPIEVQASPLAPRSSVTYEDEPGGPEAAQTSSSQDESLSLGLGACWDAHHRTWYGHFRGSLSGLSVLANDNEESRSIECLGSCSEELVSTSQGGGGSPSAWPMRDQAASQPTSGPVDDGPAPKMDNSLVAYQESQSRILLQGHDFLDVEEALTQIAYVNHRQLPSIGKRNILVDASVECSPSSLPSQLHPTLANEQPQAPSSIPIEPIRVEVDVLPSKNLPVLTISGTTNFARDYGQLIEGVALFSSVQLRSKRLNLEQFMRHSHPHSNRPLPGKTFTPSPVAGSEQANQSAQANGRMFQPSPEDADYIEDSIIGQDSDEAQQQQQQFQVQPVNLATTRRRAEACSVQVYPPLNSLHESLALPTEQINRLQLYWRQSYEGLIVYGLDSVDNYEKLIRGIVYRNQKPAFYLERVFKLVCSDLNGRLLSNEYLQTVTVIHNPNSIAMPAADTTEASEFGATTRVVTNSEPLRVASLLRQPIGKVELDSGRIEPIVAPAGGFASQQLLAQHQPLGPLNLEQSSQLDRVALAFLVFVVSLIVIMLVITLTNLKEPSIVTDSHEATLRERRGRRKRNKSNQTRSLEQQGGADFLYADELASDSGDLEQDEEETDEEEEEDFYVDEYAEPAPCDNRHCFNGVHCGQSESKLGAGKLTKRETNSIWASRLHSRRAANPSSLHSSNITDQESLAWDEEDFDNGPETTTTIVMNPMLYGEPHDGRRESKSLITEQRPNWRGAITQKPKSHLSYWSQSSVDDYEFDAPDEHAQHHDGREDTGESQLEHQYGATNGDEDNEDEQDDLLSSTCCSGLSSAASSDSTSASASTSDAEEPEANPDTDSNLARRRLCRHHHHHHHAFYGHRHNSHHHRERAEEPEMEVPWPSQAPEHEYELFHRHHFHHRCLKLDRRPEMATGALESAHSSVDRPASSRDCDWPSDDNDLTAALTCAESPSQSLASSSCMSRRRHANLQGSSGSDIDTKGP